MSARKFIMVRRGGLVHYLLLKKTQVIQSTLHAETTKTWKTGDMRFICRSLTEGSTVAGKVYIRYRARLCASIRSESKALIVCGVEVGGAPTCYHQPRFPSLKSDVCRPHRAERRH